VVRIDPAETLAAALRVQAAVHEAERDAELRAQHPYAKHPAGAASWERRRRRRILDEMERSIERTRAHLRDLDEEDGHAA
jgi:hypothetical protein